MHAGFGFEMLHEAIIDQGVEAIDAFDNDMATTAAIAAIGPTKFEEFLAAERNAACAAVAGFYKNMCLV